MLLQILFFTQANIVKSVLSVWSQCWSSLFGCPVVIHIWTPFEVTTPTICGSRCRKTLTSPTHFTPGTVSPENWTLRLLLFSPIIQQCMVGSQLWCYMAPCSPWMSVRHFQLSEKWKWIEFKLILLIVREQLKRNTTHEQAYLLIDIAVKVWRPKGKEEHSANRAQDPAICYNVCVRACVSAHACPIGKACVHVSSLRPLSFWVHFAFNNSPISPTQCWYTLSV